MTDSLRVQRYSLTECGSGYMSYQTMKENDWGEYVEIEDYERLQAKLDTAVKCLREIANVSPIPVTLSREALAKIDTDTHASVTTDANLGLCQETAGSDGMSAGGNPAARTIQIDTNTKGTI